MENLNIIEILKLGLTGLVFLLALLSFKLLSQEQNSKNEPREIIIKTINRFMTMSIILTLLVGSFSLFDISKKSKQTEKTNLVLRDYTILGYIKNKLNKKGIENVTISILEHNIKSSPTTNDGLFIIDLKKTDDSSLTLIFNKNGIEIYRKEVILNNSIRVIKLKEIFVQLKNTFLEKEKKDANDILQMAKMQKKMHNSWLKDIRNEIEIYANFEHKQKIKKIKIILEKIKKKCSIRKKEYESGLEDCKLKKENNKELDEIDKIACGGMFISMDPLENIIDTLSQLLQDINLFEQNKISKYQIIDIIEKKLKISDIKGISEN